MANKKKKPFYHNGAKPNPILASQANVLNAKHQSEMDDTRMRYWAQLNILLQMAEDACVISTSEVRGLGADNAFALRSKFRETMNEMSALMVDDTEDILYAREKIDLRLREIEKDRATPWESRFAWCLTGKKVQAWKE